MGRDRQNKTKILVIVGPTASGKSDLAVLLAQKVNGEVISADSRQVYKGLDIGSGKITKDEMRGIPHHLLSVADPQEKFTAANFKKLGEEKIEEIVERGKVPIIAGGSGFYIQSLVDNIVFPQVLPNNVLRRKLEKVSIQELYKRLVTLDPERAKTVDQKNKRRLIRAIEIVSVFHSVPQMEEGSSNYDPLFIGIDLPDTKLKEKIHSRLLARIANGMIEEVKELQKEGISWKSLEEFGLEYRYIALYLQGKLSKEEMVVKLETEIWRFAKRQRTWFKRNKDILWFQSHEIKRIDETVEQFLKS